MGFPEKEGEPTGSQQLDGSPLPLLGDLLFAGAMLFLLYPGLRRAIKLVDRQFCWQIMHVVEVSLVLAALSFVLVLMVAQQTKATYCSFVRPFVVGDDPENHVYADAALKILVCALVGCNYAFASVLQRIGGKFVQRVPESWLFGRRGSMFWHQCRGGAEADPHEVSDNSNTNSPVPPTDTSCSDVFSTISASPVMGSESSFENGVTDSLAPRLYCDVGTWVRFPEYQGGTYTMPYQDVHSPSGRMSPCNVLPHSLDSPFSSITTRSRGFCPIPQTTTSLQQNLEQSSSCAAGRFNGCMDPLAHADIIGNCPKEPGVIHVQPTRCKSSTSAAVRCPTASCHSSSNSSKAGSYLNIGCGASSNSSCRQLMGSGCCMEYSRDSLGPSTSTAPSLPPPVSRPGYTHHSRRRNQQFLTMFKMTRSGRVYGYG